MGDEREQDPLDDLSVDAPLASRVLQRASNPEPVPELVEHVGAPKTARVDDLDVEALARRDGLGGLEEPADRRDETPQCLAVDLVRPTEVVDHLRHRRACHRVPLVVGELEVADD